MTPAYASGTTVSVEKSRAELETLLAKHGADQRAFLVDDDKGIAQIAFRISGRRYRLDVPLPSKPDPALRPKPEPRGWYGWDQSRRIAWRQAQYDQACRERWRGMVLLLKAKLEIVRMGMSTVEKEFLADMLTANGQTLHVAIAESIKHALETGTAPMLALPETVER